MWHIDVHFTQLRHVIGESARRNSGQVDVVHWLSRAGVEFIAQAALGHTFGELDSNDTPPHPVVDAIKQML